MKKLLIVKPTVDDSDPSITHYNYSKSYIAEHATHICYNFANSDNIKGGHLGEGMVIYDAEESEIKALLLENGVEEIKFNIAAVLSKQWRPAMVIDGKEKPEFDISNCINESDISTKKL